MSEIMDIDLELTEVDIDGAAYIVPIDENFKKLKAAAEALKEGVKSSGDMDATTYDGDGDGVVDDAKRLGGHLPSYFATSTAHSELENLVNEFLLTGARITTLSYVGTGTYGIDNPCSLTFDKTPKYIKMVFREDLNNGFVTQLNEYSSNRVDVLWELVPENEYKKEIGFGLNKAPYGKKQDNTLLWYCTESAETQNNMAGCKYYLCVFY